MEIDETEIDAVEDIAINGEQLNHNLTITFV